MADIEPSAADRHLLFGHRREPHGDVKIYGGEIGVSLEDGRADGLLLLAFDSGFGHPMTWHLTPEDAAAFRDLFVAKAGQPDARHVAAREAGLRAEIERLRAANAELLAACKESWEVVKELDRRAAQWSIVYPHMKMPADLFDRISKAREMVEAAIARAEQPNLNPESQT